MVGIMTQKQIIKYVFFLLILTCFFCISCKNSADSKIFSIENDTIKEQVKNREQSITWTLEIEPERLSSPVSKKDPQIASDVLLSKDIIRLSSGLQSKVYPNFSDFGSLDTTNIPPVVKAKLQEFCQKLSENSLDAAFFFNNKYVFSYVFFKNELPENLEIKKWLFGEPFIGEEIILVPVRFYCNIADFDVTIYVKQKGASEFYQITIDRWKEHDGAQ